MEACRGWCVCPAKTYRGEVLVFGDCALDLSRFELSRNGSAVHVEPQVFDVLRYLLEHRERVVPKEELLDELWGNRFVSESTLTSRIKAARRAIGDDGDAQRWIRTVRSRGYRFVGEVGEVREVREVREVSEQPPAARAPGPSGGSSTPAHTVAAAPLAPSGGPASYPTPLDDVHFCRGDDGVRIAYAITGAGPPLVKAANWMTHLGHDAGHPVWRHWVRALSRNRTLIRYDERGCGLSEWDVDSFTFADWVSDLEIVVDAARLDCFPLLGISQGAAVAIAYAVRHPERVERLVLIGGYAAGRAVRARTPEERAAATLDLDLARVGWGQADPAFRKLFAMHFFPDGPPAVWDSFDELQRRTTSAANAARFLETFGTVDVRHLAGKVACPALVLHSRDDHRVPFTCAEELAALVPGSRLVPVPSSNHLLVEGEPAWPLLLDEVERFLAG